MNFEASSFSSTIVNVFLCTLLVVQTFVFLFYINIPEIFFIVPERGYCSGNAENTDFLILFQMRLKVLNF
ncbi:hypothetical protein Q762_03915 [Flavobacterium cauense R2A-7]|nr:hypothetical protein Q762_03915 [Flavobacterium cauense R2A-7]